MHSIVIQLLYAQSLSHAMIYVCAFSVFFYIFSAIFLITYVLCIRSVTKYAQLHISKRI